MTERVLTYAEKLVKELAECNDREAEFERWRWKASMGSFYRRFMVTKTVTETTVLGMKSRVSDEQWYEMPEAVAEEFHTFLAKKRDENYMRKRQIGEELEGLK